MSKTTDTTPSGTLSLESGIEALRASPEFRGPVESIDGHHHNDHLAMIYEDRAEQFAAVVPFMRQGIERGERCMYVVDEHTEEELLAAMREADVPVDEALASGQLSVHTVGETYLRDGAFDPDEMIEFYGAAVEEATEEYEALRIAAETSWVLDESTSIEQFMEYESKVNRLFDEEDCIALCQYDRRAFPPEVLREIIRTHPHLVYENTVCHNVYYTPPSEYFGPDDPEDEVERMMGTLVDRVEARTALRERERHLRELYRITADPDRSFEDKLQALFDLGCDVFDFELGAIARVDPEVDSCRIEWLSGDHEGLQPGTELPLSETYCQTVVEEGGTVSVLDDGETYGETAIYREFGMRTYIGTRIELETGADRTFFFMSTEPRSEEFSGGECTLQHLMGQWIQYELERTAREGYLRDLYQITADRELSFEEKLTGVLELGRERFGLERAHFGRYHRDRREFEVEQAVGPADQPVEEGVSEIQPEPGQFCRRTLQMDEPMGAPDVREQGWTDDPVHREAGVESYFAVRVSVGARPYGTLTFSSTSPRETGFSDAERTFLELMGQWVSHELEQRRRESQLAALNDMGRDLMDAETVTEIGERTVDHARETLQLPIVAVCGYDGETGRLSPVAQTPRAADELPTATLCDGPAWEAFVADEIREIEPDGSGFEQVVAVPLGQQGVFLAATTAPGGFDATERDVVETAAATVAAACTRADRERLLHEREATLETQNETLERLNRINTTIRDIDKALVGASTREEIERVVCQQLADTGPYELAWIGEDDAVTDAVSPREWAGADTGYFEDLSVSTDDSPEGRGPVGRAFRTREPQVVNDVLEDESFAPWRQAALNRGYHACVALPLSYQDSLYGVLTVYAGQPGVFDDLERAVLAELSDTIAHAINAVESKKALVGNEFTELEFEVEDAGLEIVELTRATGCTFSLESLVPRNDGGLRCYFSTRGAPAEEVLGFADRLAVTDLTLVTECTEGEEPICLFEAVLSDASLSETVVGHGGRLSRVDVRDGAATVTVQLAADAAVTEFVEMFRRKYPQSELTAQRTETRAQRTPTELQSALVERLTDRQLETVQTAYFNGYFEKPRTRTGSEIADTMGISQPTFNTHLRAAQRKLLRELFEEETLL